MTPFFPSYVIAGKNYTGAIQICGDKASLRKSSSPCFEGLKKMGGKNKQNLDLDINIFFFWMILRHIT